MAAAAKPEKVLVIRNAACLCPMDPARRIVLDEGAVAVCRGRVVAVGTNAEVDAVLAGNEHAGADLEVIDASNMLVLPGFIDAHCHAGHALVKTLGCGEYGAWGRACHMLYRCVPFRPSIRRFPCNPSSAVDASFPDLTLCCDKPPLFFFFPLSLSC